MRALRSLTGINHEFIILYLLSIQNKNNYENMINTLSKEEKQCINIYPIFLNMPNNRLRHLLNPTILIPSFIKFIRIFLYIKPDVVIVSYILDAYPVVILKWLLNFKLVIIATGGDINLHKGLINHSSRNFVYKFSDSIFAVSNNLSKKIKCESGHKSIVIPTGIDPTFFRFIPSFYFLREKLEFNKEDLIILTVCNLVKHKGADVIIRSIAILKKHGIKKVKLIIVGKGPQKKELENIIINLNLKKNVIFLGYRSRKELLELYNISNLCVLASYAEGLPTFLLEAMACKRICISTRVGDIPQLINNGYNGFLINSIEPLTLAKKIIEILSISEKKLSHIKQAARRTVVENFDSRTLMKKFLQNISDIMN